MKLVADILNALRADKKTVSTAESISTGYLQTRLGSVSGASDVFKGGITAYQQPVKVDVLTVDQDLAEKTNCVDEEVARQMALGALNLFKSDYAIATCGYAETDEGRPYAYIAVTEAPDHCLFSSRIELAGERIEAQQQTAELALKTLATILQSRLTGTKKT